MRTLAEQANAVSRGDVSPRELVDRAIAECERVQPALNAFTVVLADDARERADRAREGPLRGVPVAVKDLFDVRGVTTTGCCAAYTGRAPATADSAVVEALRLAGAVVVAKTNQHELACGATTQVSSAGPAFNPWGTGRITGGSSGGSGAAVAASAVAMAMGSDTGGSIRIPASLCGVTGLKPTHGSVSLRGAMAMCPSFDTAGPLARTAEDCALVWRVIAGFDPDDPLSADGVPAGSPETVERLRVALPRSFLVRATPEVAAAVQATAVALEGLGVIVDEIEGPDIDACGRAWGEVGFGEVAHVFRDLWDDERVSPLVRGFIENGRRATAADSARGRETLRRVRRDFEWSLTSADALLAPSTPIVAPQAGSGGGNLSALTIPVNVAGLPSLALPVGFSAEGLPIGAQLIGRAWSEEVLLALGAAYQTATDWHARTPDGT